MQAAKYRKWPNKVKKILPPALWHSQGRVISLRRVVFRAVISIDEPGGGSVHPTNRLS